MADNKSLSGSVNSNLPAGYKVVNFSDLSQQEQEKYGPQAHDLLVNNYPDFAKNPSEDWKVWKENIGKSGFNAEEGKKQLIVAVINDKDKLVGLTDVEILPGVNDLESGINDSKNRYVLNSYTMGAGVKEGSVFKPDINEPYAQILQATKESAQAAVNQFQAEADKHGINTQGSLQEHDKDNKKDPEKHLSKIMAGAGVQVPVVGYDNYSIPIYPSDVADAKGSTQAEKETAAIKDAAHANLFMGDMKPSDPNQSMADFIRGFSRAYIQANSAFKDHPEQDPGYQSMMKYADKLPIDLTYQQAFDINALNTKQYLGMSTDLTDKQQDAAVERIGSMSDKEKAALLSEIAKDFAMAETYKTAGDNQEQRAAALKQYPDLKTVYDGEKALQNELGRFATPAVMKQFEEIAVDTISSGGLDNMKSTLDSKQHVTPLPDPMYAHREQGPNL